MKSTIVIAGMAAVFLLAGQASFAGTENMSPSSDPEMKQIYDADQADRSGSINKIDWATIDPRDAERRKRTSQLLSEGRLHTGADFVEAAYVFQHGDTANDFLMAHTLAVIAVKKGNSGAPWIAAASLDRYLQSIGQKQIYGTQSSSHGAGWTKDPYDRDLISDALRRELNVPVSADQEAQLAKLRAQAPNTPVQTTLPTTPRSLTCTAGPVDKVFLKETWHVYGCDNGGVIVLGGGAPPAQILVSVLAGKVTTAIMQGPADDGEVKAAKAAFDAMTPEQVKALSAQARAVSGQKPN